MIMHFESKCEKIRFG